MDDLIFILYMLSVLIVAFRWWWIYKYFMKFLYWFIDFTKEENNVERTTRSKTK